MFRILILLLVFVLIFLISFSIVKLISYSRKNKEALIEFEKIQKLQELKENGIISEEEFEKAKENLLNKL